MANIVFNKIIFDTREGYEAFLRGHDKAAGFSLGWVIPQPQTRDECEAKYVLPPEKEIARNKKPWLDILRWQRDHWGVKWDAYDDIDENDEHIGFFRDESCTIAFNTPWDPPFPVYERMAEQGFCFSYTWTAELDGGYSGSGHVADGEVVIDEQHFESLENRLKK